MSRCNGVSVLFLCAFSTGIGISTLSQTDTTKKLTIDSILLRQKGLIGDLAENLLTDTVNEDLPLIRSDKRYLKYEGRFIRHIHVQTVKFGVNIRDTSKHKENRLTRFSNNIHRQTRNFVIRNNLFFHEKDKLSSFLLADNERHLRDLNFFQDAYIRVIPVRGSPDSVDIIVKTKDVLSIGGSLEVYHIKSTRLALKEENFLGWGDRLQFQTVFDLDRKNKLGYGLEYIRRNINGSFIDASMGFLNFQNAFSSGKREERMIYLHLVKPLVNRYMKWTYGTKLELHKTNNFYHSDSLYNSNLKYNYNIIDAWGTWNMDADLLYGGDKVNRLRRLTGLRVLRQFFNFKPAKYESQYNYLYADIHAVLGNFSIYRQNTFKTQYVYGFGRNEDVPDGVEATVTAGWTKINYRERPYAALSFQRYYFSKGQHYFDYSLRLGSYFYKKRFEDIAMLANLDYFGPLQKMNERWKQRFFVAASVTKQVNSEFQEPLRIESKFGLEEFYNNFQFGTFRLTLKTESVFFSPWSILYFKFAPFLFVNASLFQLKTLDKTNYNLYSAVGTGLRVRNESLIFGTMELRGMYFPRKNFQNRSWRIEFNTNIRFKYNQELIKRPEFVRVN